MRGACVYKCKHALEPHARALPPPPAPSLATRTPFAWGRVQNVCLHSTMLSSMRLLCILMHVLGGRGRLIFDSPNSRGSSH